MKNKKALKQNVITYGMVIAFWAVIQIMMKTGNLSSLAKGLLVPICMYVILAVSLNLTVGILGELSLGHAGFMCVGAFSGAFFTKVAESAIPSVGVRFFIALLIEMCIRDRSIAPSSGLMTIRWSLSSCRSGSCFNKVFTNW